MTQWPSAAKIVDGVPSVVAHSRGAEGSGGHYSYERAPGARIEWELSIAPMRTADALAFRAFIHRLRRRGVIDIRPQPAVAPTSRTLAVAVSAGADTIVLNASGFAVGDWLDVFAGGGPAFETYSDATAYTDGTGYVTVAVPTPVAYNDNTLYSDGTGYGDTVIPAPPLPLGARQSVRVVAVNGAALTIRPRIRAAYAIGSRVSPAILQMQLAPGETPVVPLVNGRSLPMTVKLIEAV